jgi:trigger factor
MKKLLVILCTMLALVGCSSSTTTEEDKVEAGDVVNIAFEGTFNGESFDGGSSDDYDLRIGSKTFVDDFEDQLIGMKVGETKTITVTFPDTYEANSELAGQDVQFKVTINEINR